MENVPTQRFEELDSLRGLAALSVAIFHFVYLYERETLPNLPVFYRKVFILLVHPFSAGREAVILFFILSGFVLSIPAVNSSPQKYPIFVIRRIFRIYFPYILAIMIAVGLATIVAGRIPHPEWFDHTWTSPVDWRSFLQHMAFVGQFKTNDFDPPVWSLVQEMRISLIFPLLCGICLRVRPSVSLAIAFMISVASTTFGNSPALRVPIVTIHYTAFFVVGIYIARERDDLSHVLRRLSRGVVVSFAIAFAFLYLFGGFLWLLISSKLTRYDLNYPSDWLTALGAAGLVLLSLNAPRFSAFLRWSPIHSLGRMSYSVYLYHYLVLLLLFALLYPRLPLLLILPLFLAITMICS